MKEKGVHETTLQHKHRLFKDMVYGDLRRAWMHFINCIDHYEMQEDVQKETLEKLEQSQDHLLELQGTKDFIDEFYHIFMDLILTM